MDDYDRHALARRHCRENLWLHQHGSGAGAEGYQRTGRHEGCVLDSWYPGGSVWEL